MRYMCMGFHDEKVWEAMPDSERNKLVEETFAYEKILRESGHVVDTKGLQRAATAATLRFESGKVSVTDGPFVETKEQLGGGHDPGGERPQSCDPVDDATAVHACGWIAGDSAD